MKLNNTSVLKFYRRTIIIALCSIAISSHGTKFNERNPDSLVHHFHTMYLQSRSAGQTGNSLRYLKLYDAYSDSLEFTRMAEERKIIEIRYDNEQKARTLNLLKQQDELNRIRLSRTRAALYITSIAVLLSALILLLVIWQIRLKALRKAVKMEQTLLLSQMNPHFVLNTLANIQSLIIRNEKEPALKYLSCFSVLVRNILESLQAETISLEKERKIITDYLEMQKLRFGDKFDYMISISQELQPEKILIPPMMSQPFIENSIDHGFRFK
jgi:LytS/YehU family sensor histidine kinase